MAAAPNGVGAPILLTETDALDKIANGSIVENLNEGGEPVAETAPKVDEPKADPRLDTVTAELEKLKDQLAESRQELQFHRGYLQSEAQRRQAETQQQQAPAAPTEPKFDWDQVGEDIKTRGAQAVADLVNKIVDYREQVNNRRVATHVDGRFTQVSAVEQKRTAMQNEVQGLEREFADVWNDKDFREACNVEANNILSMRGGKTVDDWQPGDLASAARTVYYRMVKAGKVKLPPAEGMPNPAVPASSVREIFARRPANDDLGSNGAQRGAKAPTTIADLPFPNDRERKAAQRVFAQLKALNPSLTEAGYVKNYLEGEANAAA